MAYLWEDLVMRKKIVAGNWKMNTTSTTGLALIEELKPLVATEDDDVEVIFFPPFVSLMLAVKAVEGTKIAIGAQNVFYENCGAYTGEVSASMLKDIGVQYVLVGHSERRQYFSELDDIVNRKVLKAFEFGIIPIICCGETLQQRELGITIDHIKMQIRYAFRDVSAEDAKKAVIAYEPRWAIGTGQVATCIQAEEVCGCIRECISKIYDVDTAESIRILYGGSVCAANAPEFYKAPNIDGALIGSVSLKAEFGKCVNYK